MNLQEISVLRLENQHIAKAKFNTVKEIVAWMCALQAQDFNMSKWALGIRLQDSNVAVINKAIDSGEIVRTHLLRPTWHLASSDDIGWILKLTAPQIRSAVKFRGKELGLTESVLRKSNSVIERSLRDGNHLTRPELVSELVRAGINVASNRASHLLISAETDSLICSGRLKDNRPTYALLPEWISVTKTYYRDEALRELAIRYFTSHGPATLEDFSWWSGLSSRDSRIALESASSGLSYEIIQNKTYWFATSSTPAKPDTKKVFLLPAYDEFLISYKDRTASLAFANNKEAVSSNGIFYPTIVRNSQVIGTWKYSQKKDRIVVQTDLFESKNFEKEIDFSQSSARLASFLQKEI